MRPEADADLIERARRDRSAFGEIYDLYLQRVYAFCLTLTRDREEAEDLTAQTFERALNAIGRYEHRGAPLSSWLFRIAANLARDRGRRAGRVVLLGDDPYPESADESDEENPAAWVERWERAATLRSHIATLPEDQQRAIQLRFWEGRSLLEVAEQLNRSEGAVKQLLHRAVRSLRLRVDEGMANA